MPTDESLREASGLLHHGMCEARESLSLPTTCGCCQSTQLQQVATLLDAHKALRAERDRLAGGIEHDRMLLAVHPDGVPVAQAEFDAVCYALAEAHEAMRALVDSVSFHERDEHRAAFIGHHKRRDFETAAFKLRAALPAREEG